LKYADDEAKAETGGLKYADDDARAESGGFPYSDVDTAYLVGVLAEAEAVPV
jgi:hypothetical protein